MTLASVEVVVGQIRTVTTVDLQDIQTQQVIFGKGGIMLKSKRFLILLLVTFMLVGCAPPETINLSGTGTHNRYADSPEVINEASSELFHHWDLPASLNAYRFYDEEYNIVCYAIDGYEGVGISCVSVEK